MRVADFSRLAHFANDFVIAKVSGIFADPSLVWNAGDLPLAAGARFFHAFPPLSASLFLEARIVGRDAYGGQVVDVTLNFIELRRRSCALYRARDAFLINVGVEVLLEVGRCIFVYLLACPPNAQQN